MKIYRIAILGCRSRGTSAAKAYHAHPRTEIVALCDLVQDRLEALGKIVNVSTHFTDLDEMIQKTSPDIVVVPTATELHHPLCMRVLEHGVNIEVEKPLCIDLVQADEVLSKAEEKNAQVVVHHQRRVSPTIQAVAKAYTEGKIGELRYMSACGKGYYAGYGLMNIGTHVVNNMLRFGGHCRSVVTQATAGGRELIPEDVLPSPAGMGTIAGEYTTSTLQFDNNVTGTLIQQRFPHVSSDAYVLELYGSEGRLFWSELKGSWWLPTPHYIPDGKNDRWEKLTPIYPDHFDKDKGADADDYCMVDEYVNALDENREHECSGEEGRHVIEILMGIFESAVYGRRVELPQQNRDHPLIRWRNENGLGQPKEMPRDYGNWLSEENKRLYGS
ncbi:Gfo/Idh/MocA family oxidoreductase [Candidatus Poribacteria bacterium]|nr:Gfo/Idh/MocA family oxidoreductase [Candidatus Poribacteria bacterium]